MARRLPKLCSVCAIVPHWLASLSWGEDYSYYNDTTITLRSWRGMQAQAAEAAEAEKKKRSGSGRNGGGKNEGEGEGEGEELKKEGGRGEVLIGEGEGGCDLCFMIVHFYNRDSCCKDNLRPYYLPEIMDPRTDERYRDVPLVFGRVGKKVSGRNHDYWEYTMVSLNCEIFYATLVRVPESWCPKFQPPMGYNNQDPENNVLLLKDWLDNCRRNHTKCCDIKKTMDTGTDFLPTRLLDVQAFGTGKSSSYLGNDVRLVSLSPTMGPELDTTGPESDTTGPKSDTTGPESDTTGPESDTTGPESDTTGPKSDTTGPESDTTGQESDTTGQESDTNTKFPPPYFTLSHCWGPPEKRPTTTTKANLAQQMERIPFFKLPRTFQDAIEITRKLGHRYLWIDSLCIVQDDEQDWAREASLMAEVYSYSSCTLSALSSHDSSEGLRLEPLDEDRSFLDIHHHDGHGKSDPNPFWFRIFISLSDSWGSIYRGHGWIRPSDNSPLRSRGWTLQERELSRRNIHFAKTQVLWECAELQATAQRPWHHDGIPELVPEREWEEWAGILAKGHHDRNLATTASSLLSAYLGERKWWQLVWDYSQRFLSRDTDKLAALSGIAQFYQRNHFSGERYVAGLWSSRLEDELFWYSEDKTSARRPAGYVAPSWSWASVNGRVSFTPKNPVRRFKSTREKLLAATEKDLTDPADDKDKNRDTERDRRQVICEEWKVEEINLLPKYEDPFGALKDANLIIGGARLAKVELITETLIEPDPEYIMGFHRYYNGLKIDGRWVAGHSLDVEGEAEQSGYRLWCLGMVAENDHKERPVIGGLLLREERLDFDGDLCVYSRVGRFHDMAVALFDGVEPRRIKLI